MDYRAAVDASTKTPLFTKGGLCGLKGREVEGRAIPVSRHLKRTIEVPRASGMCCYYTYEELLGIKSNFSGACYAALGNEFEVVVVAEIPVLESRDDMRRFTLLVDAMYVHERSECRQVSPQGLGF